MARNVKHTPKSAQLTIADFAAAIPKLERRVLELEAFDVSTIQQRNDPIGEALETKINATLQDIFGHDTVEFTEHAVTSFDTASFYFNHDAPLSEVREGYRNGISRCAVRLRTLIDLFKERIADAQDIPIKAPQLTSNGGKSVFLVHGHDERAKEAVARYLEKLQLKPVILHEQANEGRTIIEKFEALSEVAFAVVLLTSDDMGYPANKPDQTKSRARQNVIFELGFFTAALGRKRVCALYVDGVELPSDFSGVLYHGFDAHGAWRLLLARELKAAGLPVDLNLAL